MGRIAAVCISEKMGTPKKDIGSCRLIEDYGLEGDAHAGMERQVSLLSLEQVEDFRRRSGGVVELPPGIFGENLLVEGFDLKEYPVGTRFQSGDVLLELIQIGKKCHSGCTIMQKTGECIMPREGVFARVLRGGVISAGDGLEEVPGAVVISASESPEDVPRTGVLKDNATDCAGGMSEDAAAPEKGTPDLQRSAPYTAAILVASDRASGGEYTDRSGPRLREMLRAAGYRIGSMNLLPDDEDVLEERLRRIVKEEKPDVIFTSGGTGFSPRDRMPEATKRVIDRETPGISEAIRAHSMTITPKAMLSRAVSGICGQTLIINLPGSPKAVEECLDFILPALDHGIAILRGEGEN